MSQNGAPSLADLIPTLRREVEQKQERVTKLEAELGAERAEYHQWRKVLAKLDPEALPPEKIPQQQRKRTRTQPRISDVKYAELRDTVLEYTKDHEEFRAVDIRGVMHIDTSALTEGFERMRQERVIRLARRQGNSKWFRLTPTALRSIA